jgi:hypothetical protein
MATLLRRVSLRRAAASAAAAFCPEVELTPSTLFEVRVFIFGVEWTWGRGAVVRLLGLMLRLIVSV